MEAIACAVHHLIFKIVVIFCVSLQEDHDLLLTPFEKNLQVWRQLWRVIERSDLVVQIVDARNPLFFHSDDLDIYVKEIDLKKETLLLVNKADLLTKKQRFGIHFAQI